MDALVKIGPSSAPPLLELIRKPIDEDDFGDGIAHARALIALRDLAPQLAELTEDLVPALLATIDEGPPFDCLAIEAVNALGATTHVVPLVLADLHAGDPEMRLRGLQRASCLKEAGALDAAVHEALNDENAAVPWQRARPLYCTPANGQRRSLHRCRNRK
jgi:hypothetical protein